MAKHTTTCDLRYALLFRGQSHHWGCDASSAFLQRLCMHSHHAMITQPLERQGHCVDVFLALNPKCKALLPEVQDSGLHGGRVRHMADVQPLSRSQSSNFRHAINLFWKFAAAQGDTLAPPRERAPSFAAATHHLYDFFIVTRYDVRLLVPMVPSWACHNNPSSVGTLGIASRCGSHSYKSYRCTFDTLFVVPRAHWRAFDTSVGSADQPNSRTARCCFNEMCMAGGVKGTGQACYNVFAKRIAGGGANISFCFNPPEHGGSRSPNGPEYQCCSRGLTNWTRVMEAEVSRDPTAKLGGYEPSNASFGVRALVNPRFPGEFH